MPLTFTTLHPEAVGSFMPSSFPGSGEVHVWPFSLDVPSAVHEQYAAFLSQAEQARAGRFRFPADRRHYVAAHGCLRAILSQYCQSEPQSLVLESMPSGKPRLVCDGRPADIDFNLTHSHGRGAVVVACDRAVGIDLEKLRTEVDCRRLAERYFSAHEQSVVLSATEERLSEMFFRHWVGKEAYLKGTGVGLRLPLDQCEVLLSEDRERAVIRRQGTTAPSETWMVQYLSLEAGWMGCVAARGDGWTVRACSGSDLRGSGGPVEAEPK